MRSRLNRVNNWGQLAEESNYSVNELARRCNTSPRHLERYFLQVKNQSPHEWLNERRQENALKLLKETSCLAKEAVWQLVYKQAGPFSPEFKRYHGLSPTEIELLT
jgi:AraC-like DNA-binding protein